MAYIPWIIGLTKRREVLHIAGILRKDRRFVAACCMEMWEWVDIEGVTDEALHRNVTGVTLDSLREVVDVPGFADAMISSGWIRKGRTDDNKFCWIFPAVKEIGLSSSKERSSNAERQARWRESHKKRNGKGVTEGVTEGVTRNAKSNGLEERRGEEIREEEIREEESNGGSAALYLSPGGRHDELRTAWNDVPKYGNLPGLTACREMTAKRMGAHCARLKSSGWHWREALSRLAESEFCHGGGKDGWRADIDWFLRPDTVARILEGKYDNRELPGNTDPHGNLATLARIERSIHERHEHDRAG